MLGYGLISESKLAEIRDEGATIWALIQTPFPTRDRVAKALGLKSQDVRVITPFVGGGFGGKSADDQAVDAALLAQITVKPVQVAWTRSEEFFNDSFDLAAVVKMVSSIDREGRISLWDYSVYAAGEWGASASYDIANARIRSIGRASLYGATGEAPVHPFADHGGGPGASMNVFATESQIDMMAAAAAIDPLECRLKNLTDARMRWVLLAAAGAFGWTAAAGPSGRGYGIACVIDAGTYVATMAEVKVDRSTGKVNVLRVVSEQDMGVVVNPEGAKMQIEGGITMGLGYTMTEELCLKGGEILDSNTSTLTRFPASASSLESRRFSSRTTTSATRGQRPSITTTGAVIANAAFNAIGMRAFRLPMTAERVRMAIGTMDAEADVVTRR